MESPEKHVARHVSACVYTLTAGYVGYVFARSLIRAARDATASTRAWRRRRRLADMGGQIVQNPGWNQS